MTVLDLVVVRRLTLAQLRRALLTVPAAVLFGLGWVLSKLVFGVTSSLTAVLFGLGYAVSWSFAAVKVGYQAGRRGSA